MRILIVPGLIVVFSLAVILAAFQLELSPEMIVGDSMQPRVFPIALMAANLAFAVTLFFNYRAEPPKKIKMEGLRTWGSIVLFGVFYLITIYLDMLIAIAVVMFVMCLLWGERRIHIAAVISLLTPASIFLLFDLVLRIRFPRGLITNWYYG